MSERTRELTFEEEAGLYEAEAGWIFAKEKEDGGESSFVNNVLRRGVRIIRKAREKIDAPAIDPVKHGRWELWEKVERVSGNIFKCSSCGNVFFLIAGTPPDNRYNYCPNCGAKMIAEEE